MDKSLRVFWGSTGEYCSRHSIRKDHDGIFGSLDIAVGGANSLLADNILDFQWGVEPFPHLKSARPRWFRSASNLCHGKHTCPPGCQLGRGSGVVGLAS